MPVRIKKGVDKVETDVVRVRTLHVIEKGREVTTRTRNPWLLKSFRRDSKATGRTKEQSSEQDKRYLVHRRLP